MDIEKLIERLSKYSEPVIAYKLDADFAASITDAISELRCKCDGCSVPATTAEMIRDLNDAPKLRAENEKLRAELERVKAERNAAIKDIWVPKWISCKHGESCGFISAVTGMPDCTGCADWEWRGQKED